MRLFFGEPLGGGVKAVSDEVEEDPGKLLREERHLARGRIEVALQRDVESRLLGTGAVIGEVQRLLDQCVQVDVPPLLHAAVSRMQQHVAHDGVGALAVLHDTAEIVLQEPRDVVDLAADLLGQLVFRCAQGLLQLLDQFG